MTQARLPNFEGVPVEDAALAFTGKVDDPKYLAPGHFALGEEVILVVRGSIVRVAHEGDPDESLTRVQTVKVAEAYPLGDDRKEVFLDARAEADEARDQATGRQKLVKP